MNPEPTSRPRASRIPFVAALLAGSMLFSRALGLVREMVLAGQLGAGPEVDAYRQRYEDFARMLGASRMNRGGGRSE